MALRTVAKSTKGAKSRGSIRHATSENINRAISGWLGEITSDVAFNADVRKSVTSPIRVTSKSGRKRGVVSAVGKDAKYKAGDIEFYVPVGGFARPGGGHLPWPIRGWGIPSEKNPEGILFRTRTYSRYGGQIFRRRGFMMDAFRDVFETHGVENLMELGTDVCFEIAKVIVRNLIPRLVSFEAYAGREAVVTIRARVGGKFYAHSINETFRL